MASCGNEFTFTWKIENFSCLPHQPGERLTSTEFIVESAMKSKWCLWLYPRGYSNNDDQGKDHISLFLCNLEQTPLKVHYDFILETTNVPFKVQTPKNITKDVAPDIGSGAFKAISLASLYEEKHLYLPQDVLTVVCCIRPDRKNEELLKNTESPIVPNPFRRQCLSITRIKVQRRYLTWRIKEISEHFENRINTKISLNGALKDMPSLSLSFSISKNSNEEYAQIEILQTHSIYKEKHLFVKCKMSILTADKLYQNSIEGTHLFSLKLDDIWQFPAFIRTKNLKDEKYLYVDDTLVLQCDFSFTCPGTEYHIEAPQYAPWHLEVKKPSKKNQLCGSIRHLYRSADLCDVILYADGKTFPAHKLVLCARSSVFSAMFQNEMKEKDTNVVEIVDVDARTLEFFLRFLYSDIVDEELTSEDACNLYKAADKYQVELLKRQCSILLLSTLSVSSVCDVIVLADAHQDHFLMSAVNNCLQYHLNETLNSKEWKEFMDRCPKLSGIVMFKALKSKPFL